MDDRLPIMKCFTRKGQYILVTHIWKLIFAVRCTRKARTSGIQKFLHDKCNSQLNQAILVLMIRPECSNRLGMIMHYGDVTRTRKKEVSPGRLGSNKNGLSNSKRRNEKKIAYILRCKRPTDKDCRAVLTWNGNKI